MDLLTELVQAAEEIAQKKGDNRRIEEIDIFKDKNSEEKSSNKSYIHTGESDSSEDEDNKYFEQAKYNEYGKNIKKLLQNSNNDTQSRNITENITWKTKRNKELALPQNNKLAQTSKDVFVDPFFGIRIINPLVSSATFQERMVDRESVPMVKLKWYVQKLTPDKNWVIAGVIVQKSATKTSQKGNQFAIWTLSDLHGDLKTATIFLFGKAYQNLWKTVVGTVVGILNPNVFNKKDTLKAEACLSVDNHQKIMILGQSKDFGICKSTKKSGEACTAFVNTNQSEHCIYHLKQEYQKYSKRSDMQSSFQGRGLTALRNKVLGKNEVFYAGKSYMAIPATKSKKLTAKNDSTLKALKGGNALVNSNQAIKAKNLSNRKKTANRIELDKNQRAKDLALLRRLGASKELDVDLDKKSEFAGNVSKEVSLDESKQAALSVINKLKGNRLQEDGGSGRKEEFSTAKLSKMVSLGESKNAALDVIKKLKDRSKPVVKKGGKSAENTEKLEEINSEQRAAPAEEGMDMKAPGNVEAGASKMNNRISKNREKLEKVNSGQRAVPAEDIEAYMNEISEGIDVGPPSNLEAGASMTKIDKKSTKNQENFEKISTGQRAVPAENRQAFMSEISEEIDIERRNSIKGVVAGARLPKLNIKSAGNEEKIEKNNTEQRAVPAEDMQAYMNEISEGIDIEPPSNVEAGASMTKMDKKSPKNQEKLEKISAGQRAVLAENRQAFMSEISEEIDTERRNSIKGVVAGARLPKLNTKSAGNEEKIEKNNTEQRAVPAEDMQAYMNEISEGIDIEPPSNIEDVAAGVSMTKINKKSSKTQEKLRKVATGQRAAPAGGGTDMKNKKNPTKNKDKTKVIKTGVESTPPNLTSSRPFLNTFTNQPFLKHNPGATIDLNSPISKKLIDKAKLNALKYVQKNGQIKKSDPMSVKSTGKKRPLAGADFLAENDPKKQKIQENEFFSERFKKMMAATSSHADLLEKRDEEEQEKYFKKLEIKEKMEEKMATTFKLECKAVRCLKCKYTSFSASDRCKEEKHPLRVFDTFKRFFKCGNCGNRTVCLEVVPTVACKNCGSGKCERTSMMKEKNVKNLHSLSIRGGEQKFLNSTISDANLSLLVSME